MLRKSISAKLGMFRFVLRSIGFKGPSLNAMLLLAAWLVASPFGQAYAATFFWDATGATAGTGGTGNWETTSSLWRASSDTGTLGIWSNIGGDNDAFLGGTAGTLTLTTGILANDITVDPTSGTAYIIGGATQTLTLVGTAQSVIDVASGDSLAITSGLTGTNGFTKNSAGTLNLDSAAGTAQLLGSITLNGGTLQAGSATNNGASQVLRSNAVNLAGGTSLTTVGTTIDLRVGSLSGSGSVTPATGGAVNILTLADSTFSGTITTTGGLNLRGANGTTQTLSGNLTGLTGTVGINSGATIRLSGTGNATSGVLGSSALATRGGTLTLDNSGGNTSATAGRIADTAAVTMLGGTLSLIGNSAGTTETVGTFAMNSGSSTISVTNNGGTGAVLAFTDSGSLRDSTSGTLNFIGLGTGTLGSAGNAPRITFSGALNANTVNNALTSTASGSTSVTYGWARVNGTSWAGNGANGIVALAEVTRNSATLGAAAANEITTFTPSNTTTTLAAGLGAATTPLLLKITPSGSGQSLASGGFSINASAVMLTGTTDFSITGSGSMFGTVASTRYIYTTDANTVFSVSQSFAGSNQPFNKSGPGTLSLNGASNQLGFTTAQNVNIIEGTLRGSLTSLGGGASSGGAFTTLNLYGGTLELSGGGTFSRALGVAGASGGGGLFINNSGTARGDGGFSAIGANASVNLVTAVGGATAAAPVWDTTAGFVSNGYALLFGSSRADSRIDFTNNVGLDNGTATNSYFAREIRVTDNTGSSTDIARLSGIISGSANADLLKTGAGVLELTGGNTYSGNTLISAGTLQVGSGSTTGTLGSTGAIQNNGILSVNRSDAFSITAPISGTGSLTKLAAGTLTLSGANTYSGGTTISGGTLQVGNGGTTGTLGSTSAVTNNAALVINRSDSITVTPVISGTGSLTQAGAGTTTVTGPNTFTGAVNVTGGTLAVATVGASTVAQPLGQAATPVTLSSGGRLSYTGVGTSWDRGITVTPGSTGTVRNSGSGELTLTGPISKDGSTLTFSGTQPIKVSSVITGASANSDLVIEDTTVTLSNANTYNGPTTINNGGKLVVTNTTGSATSTGNVQANSGSVILGTGFIQPASGGTVTISSGATVSVGNASGDTTGKVLTFTPASGGITTTFQSGSIIEFDLFSGAGLGDQSGNLAAADLFRTGGLFDISTGVKLKVTSAMTGFAANDRWRLLDWNTLGGTAPTGTFDTALFELPTLTGMLGWDLSQFYTAGTISVAAVPEPTRALLLAFGLVGILIRRRR
jgi:fibronectin-binding autotransporter adhesin